ncbi:uncharacterized protein LOC108094321 [Drosophila ficusphila]|uniref:uncharacterized protein LOC108094321 n=1 Tax=Drosophila ficusphila TaxID=30025 RepID=UPI0007E60E4F|nr:uncharacterized protein LOC108094321 [Drosophila ficusphila]
MSSASVSRYKRKTGKENISLENAVLAVKAILLNNEKLRPVARSYNFPRTSLKRYVDKVKEDYPDISTISDENLAKTIKLLGNFATCQVFSDEQEEALVGYIKKCCDHYYGLSIVEMRQLAYQYANKIGTHYPLTWNVNGMSGRDWYYGFMRRHPQLTLRTPEQTSLNRVNPDIFMDSDYVQAAFSGENDRAVREAEVNEKDSSRRIVISCVTEINERAETSSSTEPSVSTSRDTSSLLNIIGPLQAPTSTAKKSNRGRRPMSSTILTSPESLDALREKQRAKKTTSAPKAKIPAKRGRPPKKLQL